MSKLVTPTKRSAAFLLPLGLLFCVGCASAPGYQRRVGPTGELEPAESVSLESRDYHDLARLLTEKLKKSSVYERQLRNIPGRKKSPAIAHKSFVIDISDLNTKAALVEQRIRSEFQNAGIRYISEQDRNSMIESLKLQNSDLNDPKTRGKFGKFANAKYYLVGKLYEVEHYISTRRKKREFHLFIDLLELETMESVFTADVQITKYMSG